MRHTYLPSCSPAPSGGAEGFNLSESTVRSLRLADVLTPADDDELRSLAFDYGDRAGLPALRDLLAARCGVTPAAVLTVPGTMLGLHLLARALRGSGEDAVIVTPCFGPMRTALEQAGLRARPIRLHFDEGYRADVARIATMLRRETRLVVLANPNNPSGVHMTRAAIRDLLAAMARRAPRAVLFVDETYREATYGAPAARSVADLDPRIVTAGSLSKAHGAPGLRIGWLTVPDTALQQRLAAAKESLILSGSVLDETLAAALLRRSDGILATQRQALAGALEAVLHWHSAHSDLVDMTCPDAGAVCCLRLNPALSSTASLARFWSALPGEQLRLAPGPWFGETPRVFRLGFGHLPLTDLREALGALSRVLGEAAR